MERAPADEIVPTPPNAATRETIPRFLRSERLLHWALAIPFVVLYASALLLLVTWGEAQPRHLHRLAGWLHRAGGVGLIVLPPLALIAGRSQWRIHFENLREGWIWRRDDLAWLGRAPRAAIDTRTTLPEQGKFNAAEKLNFMMVCVTYGLYIVTGLLVWLPGAAFLPWVAHGAMAVIGLPLVLGHIFMAAVNPSTRVGLSGMITGYVNGEWAKHHYGRWFREQFEAAPAAPVAILPDHQPDATDGILPDPEPGQEADPREEQRGDAA